MKPFVGKIVQFLETMQQKPWAAIVIAIKEDDVSKETGSVDLQLFSPVSGGVHIARAIPFSEKIKERHWTHVPEHHHDKQGHEVYENEAVNKKPLDSKGKK